MERLPLTTLCYIEKENQYLMLHRIKKKNDGNHDKWIGIGGHFEDGESPEDCLLREAREETGLTLTRYRFRAFITFQQGDWKEYMCLYTADRFEGELIDCNEGELVWVDKDKVNDLNTWTGDRIFMDLIAGDHPFFSLKLTYEGETLTEAILDGEKLDIPGQDY
jgi:8-oxo-dGTP diphosphatase